MRGNQIDLPHGFDSVSSIGAAPLGNFPIAHPSSASLTPREEQSQAAKAQPR